ncbi:MAG: DUF1190 domain-containing protein [Steroidobacteraceae bacterium]
MKRSRSIQLVLMGTVPLLLSACDHPPSPPAPPSPQAAVAYQGLTQCISDGKVSADICEKAYADAVQAQYRDGPRFDSLSDCQAQYGWDQCHHVQTSSGGWFMPALAGFMVGRALGNHGYNYGYGYGGGYGQPLYRYRGDRAEWRTASGERFGAGARGPSSPSVGETLSRGGFGMTSAARASWGG